MRAPVDTILAPQFLPHLRWVNVKSLRMDRQQGTPVLVEFWDFCRPNSMRTLPYLKAWHERYQAGGLVVVGIHSPGFAPARERAAVESAIARLGISYPVLLDPDLEMWQEYENAGWPARYLFDGRSVLFDFHYGEGAYAETELAIQELLGVARDPLPPLRPEDAPNARLAPQSEDREGPYSGPYEAGGVWLVLDGQGSVSAQLGSAGAAELASAHPGSYSLAEHDRHAAGGAELAGARPGSYALAEHDRHAAELAGAPPEHERHAPGALQLTVTHPGAYPLVEHGRHTAGALELELGEGVECLATCFTPGLAPAQS